MSSEDTQPDPATAASAAASGPATRRRRGIRNYLAVMTMCPRRFCCQQPSVDSVQKGRSFP